MTWQHSRLLRRHTLSHYASLRTQRRVITDYCHARNVEVIACLGAIEPRTAWAENDVCRENLGKVEETQKAESRESSEAVTSADGVADAAAAEADRTVEAVAHEADLVGRAWALHQRIHEAHGV